MYPPNISYQRNKLIVITALITMAITSILWVGIGAGGYWLVYRQPPKFQIEVEYPEFVELGETFELKVKVENAGADKITLANIDIYDELSEGFEIIDVSPKPRTKERLMGFTSYNLNEGLAAAEVYEFTFKLKAKEVGYWSGDIDACTPMQNLVTHYTEIEVVDPAAEKTAEEDAEKSDADETSE